MSVATKIIASDYHSIPYRKELNKVTGSIIASLVLQQFIYWDSKNGNREFYKFIEPCDNELYNDGDSWTEELGISKKQFTNAVKILQQKGVVSKRINMMRTTYYKLHHGPLEQLLKEAYISDEKELMGESKSNLDYSKNCNNTETTTETTTDIEPKQKNEFSFSLKRNTQYENLTEQYKQKLRGYAVTKDGAYQLDKFLNHHVSKGTTYKNWSMAYNTWLSNAAKYDPNYNLDATKKVRNDHPDFNEVFVEYGTNNTFNSNYDHCGTFTIKHNEPCETNSQASTPRDVMGLVAGGKK